MTILPSASLSLLARSQNLTDWASLLHYLRHLPYGRTADRTDLSLVFKEGKGTCSSKHALAYAIAKEQAWRDWELIIGMYKMSAANTPGIGDVLAAAEMTYLPEAHCYLRRGEERIDITNPQSDFNKLADSILGETAIAATQIGQWKIDYHRSFISSWIAENQIGKSLDEVWQIREACIQALTAKN